MKTELKPCPFCGSPPFVHGLSDACTIMCEKCGAEGPMIEGQHSERRAAEAWNRRAAPAVPIPHTGQGEHPDNAAVDRFAAAMKHKLAVSRDKGRSGWDDETQCSMASLAEMLVNHVAKGDPVDIANFAMMLHQREAMAMEHHPCYGGDAIRYIRDAATAAPSEGAQEVKCETCEGKRVIADPMFDGMIAACTDCTAPTITEPCSLCGGADTTDGSVCPHCDGSKVETNRVVADGGIGGARGGLPDPIKTGEKPVVDGETGGLLGGAHCGETASIDTPEFSRLVGKLVEAARGDRDTHYPSARQALTAHIDAHIKAARQEGYEAGLTKRTDVAVRQMKRIAELEAAPAASGDLPGSMSLLRDFADEVKELCRDFSSRTGSVYVSDVQGAIDGLYDLYAKDRAAALPRVRTDGGSK